MYVLLRSDFYNLLLLFLRLTVFTNMVCYKILFKFANLLLHFYISVFNLQFFSIMMCSICFIIICCLVIRYILYSCTWREIEREREERERDYKFA